MKKQVFRYFAWVTLLVLAVACAIAQGEKEEAVAETLIRQRVEDWAKAVSAKDIDRVLSLYAPNIVSFDLDPPLRYAGADNKRKAWQEFFAVHTGPMAYEVRELNVTTHGDLAFVHSLNHGHAAERLHERHVGAFGRRVSSESMAPGWLCTIMCQSQQISSMARLF